MLPISPLRARFSKDADLGFHMISKLYQGLRQSQRHAFLLANRHVRVKLAMFLQLLEQLQAAKGEPTNDIYLPMDRSDIAEYLGISLSAVSRGFHACIIAIRSRRHVAIVNRQAFELLAGSQPRRLPIPHKEE